MAVLCWFPLRIWGVPETAVFFACILGFGTGDIWYLANCLQQRFAIALNNTLAVKFQIENLDNPMIPYQTRIELINKLLESTIKSIQEAQELHDIE